MDKCPAVFTERKKTDEFGIAIATIYGLFVCFKSSPGNKYSMNNAVLINIAFITV